MTAFYNELDPFAAEWLRNLIAADHIAPGIVDQRPIQEIEAWELEGFTQCHFFAGIGIWSLALRRGGWPDDAPIWTGSCPCQPFSAAGQQKGFDDARHLWPHWFRLIAQRRPAIVLGEQVASALQWLDLVSADMEGAGYAFGAADMCAAGFGEAGWGGYHIRQRLGFVAVEGMAHADSAGRGQAGRDLAGDLQAHGAGPGNRAGDGSADGGMGNPCVESCERRAGTVPSSQASSASPWCTDGRHDNRYSDAGEAGGLADAMLAGRTERGTVTGHGSPAGRGAAGGLVDTDRANSTEIGAGDDPFDRERAPVGRRAEQPSGLGAGSRISRRDNREGRGAVGFTRDVAELDRPDAPDSGRMPADWLFCRDGKWRPVEPGTFPLADADTARVGRLRAYGNALDAEAFTQFCAAAREAIVDLRSVREFDL